MKCPYVMRKCTKCGEIKVANNMNFAKAKKGKWGLASQCKECKNKYSRKHRKENKEYYKEYREGKKEYYKEYRKEYYNSHKEKIKERAKLQREENEDYLKEYKKNYRKENKEKIAESKRRWYENNPQATFNSSSRRRTKEETQGNGITKEQWLEMMNFFEWTCAYSGEYLGGKCNKNIRSVDHIVALDNGGENEVWNCVPMYISHNKSKHTKDMLEWYLEQPFFSIERLTKIYEWRIYAYWKWKEETE